MRAGPVIENVPTRAGAGPPLPTGASVSAADVVLDGAVPAAEVGDGAEDVLEGAVGGGALATGSSSEEHAASVRPVAVTVSAARTRTPARGVDREVERMWSTVSPGV